MEFTHMSEVFKITLGLYAVLVVTGACAFAWAYQASKAIERRKLPLKDGVV